MAVKLDDLLFWIETNQNALFNGKHGVGKTSMVKEAFEQADLNWRYFSAATMDPWVDFIGVPRAVEGADGKEVLEMVRPADFANDEVEALFFDEFNRSHKKTRNAVMELLQFKSINGRPFKNLRIVWAAVNPDDIETYDVEALDPAQRDRFEVQVDIPYKCNKEFFTKEFGKNMADSAISWWNGLPDKIKSEVTPRRLEYALRFANHGGKLRHILPSSCNPSKLASSLRLGPIEDVVAAIMASKDTSKAAAFLSDENSFAAAINYILKRHDRMKFFMPVMKPEKLASLFAKRSRVLEFAIEHCIGDPNVLNSIEQIYQGVGNKAMKARIAAICADVPADKLPQSMAGLSAVIKGVAPPKHGSNQSPSSKRFMQKLMMSNHGDYGNTHTRRQLYRKIETYLPRSMPVDQATKSLSVLANIVNRSNASTLKSMKNLTGLVNHCSQQMRGGGMKASAVKLRVTAIKQRLKAIGRDDQIWVPQQ